MTTALHAWDDLAAAPTPWAAAQWSERGQTRRMQACLHHAHPRAGDTLLDYGCGTGRLTAFLPHGVRYTGFDPSLAMIERAQTDQPGHEFHSAVPDREYDHVIAIGPWNLREDCEPDQAHAAIRLLFLRHVRHTLTASLYRGHDPRCNRYTASELAQLGESLTDSYLIDATALPNDLILHLRQP